jgi:hypothetical protein
MVELMVKVEFPATTLGESAWLALKFKLSPVFQVLLCGPRTMARTRVVRGRPRMLVAAEEGASRTAVFKPI